MQILCSGLFQNQIFIKERNKILLKIDVNPEDILKNKNGRIVINLHYYSKFSTGAHLCTIEGKTLEDFEKGKVKKSKNIFVGQNGGISIG